MKGTRDSFGEALLEVGRHNPRVVALDADLSVSTKSVMFAKEFPGRFFQMGIAEANMVGTAAGLSFCGWIPFLCSFGAFVAGRYETIRVSVGYSKANVKIVGTHAGLGIGDDGYTQMGLEDVNVMRGVPGMAVIQPSDHLSTIEAVQFSARHSGPVYLRLTRQKLPAIYKPGTPAFTYGKANIIRKGSGVALLASGATVHEAIKAAETIKDPWIVDFSTIKPIDTDLIRSLAGQCKRIITVEDHNIIGGLGSAVAEVLAETGYSGTLERLGVQDTYGESGDPGELYEKYGFSANQISLRFHGSL